MKCLRSCFLVASTDRQMAFGVSRLIRNFCSIFWIASLISKKIRLKLMGSPVLPNCRQELLISEWHSILFVQGSKIVQTVLGKPAFYVFLLTATVAILKSIYPPRYPFLSAFLCHCVTVVSISSTFLIFFSRLLFFRKTLISRYERIDLGWDSNNRKQWQERNPLSVIS